MHCWLKKQGVEFAHVAMLGRQRFMGVDGARLSCICENAGLPLSKEQAAKIIAEEAGFIEPFYRWLGASRIDSFDVSPFEGATHLWDMNEALPSGCADHYDFVFDGGTLEHVLHYPDALRESFCLLKNRGCFLSATPANSYLGHGFYQFSPELPMQLLNGRNGMDHLATFVVENRRNPVFFEVKPQNSGRTLAATFWPTQMFFCGKRCGPIPDRLAAMQSDYEAAWQSHVHTEREMHPLVKMVERWVRMFPDHWRNDLLRHGKLILVWLTGNAFFDNRLFTKRADI